MYNTAPARTGAVRRDSGPVPSPACADALAPRRLRVPDLTPRTKIVQQRVSEIARLGSTLQDAGIKIDSVASSIATKSGRAMIEALIDGERRGPVLAQLAKGTMRAKIADLSMALEGRFSDHHALMCRLHLDHIDHLEEAIARLDARIEQMMEPFQCWRDLLITVPGIGRPCHDITGQGPPPAQLRTIHVSDNRGDQSGNALGNPEPPPPPGKPRPRFQVPQTPASPRTTVLTANDAATLTLSVAEQVRSTTVPAAFMVGESAQHRPRIPRRTGRTRKPAKARGTREPPHSPGFPGSPGPPPALPPARGRAAHATHDSHTAPTPATTETSTPARRNSSTPGPGSAETAPRRRRRALPSTKRPPYRRDPPAQHRSRTRRQGHASYATPTLPAPTLPAG
jgi:hypothetical protein